MTPWIALDGIEVPCLHFLQLDHSLSLSPALTSRHFPFLSALSAIFLSYPLRHHHAVLGSRGAMRDARPPPVPHVQIREIGGVGTVTNLDLSWEVGYKITFPIHAGWTTMYE